MLAPAHTVNAKDALESIAETDVSVTERVIGDKEMPGVCSSPDNESEPALSGKKRVRLILVR